MAVSIFATSRRGKALREVYFNRCDWLEEPTVKEVMPVSVLRPERHSSANWCKQQFRQADILLFGWLLTNAQVIQTRNYPALVLVYRGYADTHI